MAPPSGTGTNSGLDTGTGNAAFASPASRPNAQIESAAMADMRDNTVLSCGLLSCGESIRFMCGSRGSLTGDRLCDGRQDNKAAGGYAAGTGFTLSICNDNAVYQGREVRPEQDIRTAIRRNYFSFMRRTSHVNWCLQLRNSAHNFLCDQYVSLISKALPMAKKITHSARHDAV